MCSDRDQYDRVCRGEFAAIHTKLDRLDEAVRGVRLMYRIAAKDP